MRLSSLFVMNIVCHDFHDVVKGTNYNITPPGIREDIMESHILNGDGMTSPDSSSRVGARVRALRRHLGLTQQQVAEITGVVARKVSAWERGDQRPSFAASIDLKNHCGVTLDWLYAGDFSSLPPDMREPLRKELSLAEAELLQE